MMPTKTLTSRELNQDIGRAKRAAKSGPVVITDRGRPAHVLISYEEYQRLTGSGRSLAQSLALSGMSDIDFAPHKSDLSLNVPDFD